MAKMTKEDLIEFGMKMEMEGRGYFFESYVSREELESLPDGLREVCIAIQDNMRRLNEEFIKAGVSPDEFEY